MNNSCRPLGDHQQTFGISHAEAAATLSRIWSCDFGSSPSMATSAGRIAVWKSGIGPDNIPPLR